MSKAYVKSWIPLPSEPGRFTRHRAEFDHTSEHAMSLETSGAAEEFCKELAASGIKVGSKTCKDFRVEPRAPNQFVIFCDYPGSVDEEDKQC